MMSDLITQIKQLPTCINKYTSADLAFVIFNSDKQQHIHCIRLPEMCKIKHKELAKIMHNKLPFRFTSTPSIDNINELICRMMYYSYEGEQNACKSSKYSNEDVINEIKKKLKDGNCDKQMREKLEKILEKQQNMSDNIIDGLFKDRIKIGAIARKAYTTLMQNSKTSEMLFNEIKLFSVKIKSDADSMGGDYVLPNSSREKFFDCSGNKISTIVQKSPKCNLLSERVMVTSITFDNDDVYVAPALDNERHITKAKSSDDVYVAPTRRNDLSPTSKIEHAFSSNDLTHIQNKKIDGKSKRDVYVMPLRCTARDGENKDASVDNGKNKSNQPKQVNFIKLNDMIDNYDTMFPDKLSIEESPTTRKTIKSNIHLIDVVLAQKRVANAVSITAKITQPIDLIYAADDIVDELCCFQDDKCDDTADFDEGDYIEEDYDLNALCNVCALYDDKYKILVSPVGKNNNTIERLLESIPQYDWDYIYSNEDLSDDDMNDNNMSNNNMNNDNMNDDNMNDDNMNDDNMSNSDSAYVSQTQANVIKFSSHEVTIDDTTISTTVTHTCFITNTSNIDDFNALNDNSIFSWL